MRAWTGWSIPIASDELHSAADLMAKRRLEKTAGDYVAIAVSPVLIMLLVGSLVFFLLEISYDGQFMGRLRWILFWFVAASVLVGRISIEQGPGAARVYGLALAIAVSVVVFRFVDNFLIALCLLGVVWWCTDKLTWDCTLIDDTQDASGEGLLQTAGIADESDGEGDEEGAVKVALKSTADGGESEQSDEEKRPSSLSELMEREREAGDKKGHSPGLWLIYFSLAALPLFGLGQLLIPAENAAGREFSFRLLWIYVAAAFGLLLTTSFLGLRRYLRQRRVRMPASIAGLWVGIGGGLIAMILLLSLFLPRPDADYSLNALVEKVSSKVASASRLAFLDKDAGEGEGQRTGDGDKEKGESGTEDNGEKQTGGNGAKKGSRQAGSGSAKAKGASAGEDQKGSQSGGKEGKKGNGKQKQTRKQGSQKGKQGKKSSGKSGRGEKSDEQNKEEEESGDKMAEGAKAEQNGSDRKRTPPPETGSPREPMSNTIKWLLYAILAAVGLYFLFRHWPLVAATLRQFWEELLAFWRDLFGRKEKEQKQPGAAADQTAGLPAARRPFSSYSNPFTSGAARGMDPEELIRYTFEALEAWAGEQHLERKPDQTPLEFARLVGERVSALSKEVGQVAKLYVRVAYAGVSPSAESLPVLKRLWSRLG